MANTAAMFGKGIENILNGSIDLGSDLFYVLLLTDSYTPAINTHNDRDDLTNEYSGAGYTTNGQELTNDSVIAITGGGKYDGDDLTWTGLATTSTGVKYAVLYKKTASTATDLLVALFTLENPVAPGGANFTLQWHTSGLLSAS